MNRKKLYKETTDILYEAYFNDTLERRNACGCAVGNIIGRKSGYKVVKVDPNFPEDVSWKGRFGRLIDPCWHEILDGENNELSSKAERQIQISGYSRKELCMIEGAFEWLPGREMNSDELMFYGLCNVLSILDDIHEVTEANENQDRFKEIYDKKTSKQNLITI